MTRHLKWIVASSLSVGGFAFMGCDRNDNVRSDANNPNPTVTNRDDAAQTAGANLPGDQIGTVDLTNIYNSLGNTVEQATSKGEFDDVVDHFDKPDRDRIGNFKDQKFADLDGTVDQFKKDWKAKYSHDLDIDNSKVFENWAKVTKDGETKDWTKVNVVLPAGHGLPELTIPLIKHQMTWKIDVPDQMGGEQLKSGLMAHLNHFGGMKDKWEANELEAKRALAHHVFMALMNKPMTDLGGALK